MMRKYLVLPRLVDLRMGMVPWEAYVAAGYGCSVPLIWHPSFGTQVRHRRAFFTSLDRFVEYMNKSREYVRPPATYVTMETLGYRVKHLAEQWYNKRSETRDRGAS
jgi:hypothetical protein